MYCSCRHPGYESFHVAIVFLVVHAPVVLLSSRLIECYNTWPLAASLCNFKLIRFVMGVYNNKFTSVNPFSPGLFFC